LTTSATASQSIGVLATLAVLAAVCLPSPASNWQNAWPEVHGTAHGGSVWALTLFISRYQEVAVYDFVPRRRAEILWRVTGGGPLRVVAHGPGGVRIPMRARPDDATAWVRPGREWRTALVFPRAGCWRIHVTTRTTRGDVTLLFR
jgi:hypothetical protein